MAANPMTQFEVYRIGPEIKIGTFDISFTNASLFMVISSLAILIIFNLGSKKNSIFYSALWQCYGFKRVGYAFFLGEGKNRGYPHN